MNAATFSTMSRLILLRQKQLMALARMRGSKLAQMSSSANFTLQNRSASSSSSSGDSTPAKTTFGTGEFGRPAEFPKGVVMPHLRPGEATDDHPFSYSPVYRKSRFDWLFGEGWRRPPAQDQGQRLRRDWYCYGFHPTDEYMDWKWSHYVWFWFYVIGCCGSAFMLLYSPDRPEMKEWATREAFLEMARREKYGLPYISKDYIDPNKIMETLPSEEELGDFDIII